MRRPHTKIGNPSRNFIAVKSTKQSQELGSKHIVTQTKGLEKHLDKARK